MEKAVEQQQPSDNQEPESLSISTIVNDWLAHHTDDLYRWRRHFHQHPELSDQEYQTTATISSILQDHGLTPQLFPNTGLMVDIGPDTPEKIAFRADIDALPIQEHTGCDFSSQTAGVMHACGHDVHITVALGLACALAEADRQGILNIGIRVIFQPAEEVMDSGAPELIKLGVLGGISNIFAIHAEPKIRTGMVGVRVGPITSAGDVIEVKVTGSGGHSSRPHLTNDVVYALSKIVTDLPGLLTRRVDPRTATVMVFGAINAGFAPNAIPEEGTIRGTIRTGDIHVWRTIQPLLEELIGAIVAPTGAEYHITYVKGVPPVINDDIATAILADAARAIDPQAVVQAPQSSGGEDFSWYLEHVSGSMARLGCWDGVSEKGDLHKGNMLADENCIPVGVRLFGGVADRFNGQGEKIFTTTT
ncbi:MAG: amidohydrolase [Corynebacterium sp.]|nr:amidohydrolase [Corynebacterium sp.]